jgi:ADP-dependent phosphofructokinase/glucokinase
MANNNWKWGESSNNAFKLIAQAFDFNADTIRTVKDGDVTKQLKEADASEIQVKRIQDYVGATKKRWKNSLRANAMLHGLVRTGLQILGQKQQQESTTTKEYAKAITKTRVLSAKTHTAVEKSYLKGAKEIEKTGKDLQRYTGELNEQYQVIDQTAETQSQQRRVGYRDRVQKRLAANARPWRNY